MSEQTLEIVEEGTGTPYYLVFDQGPEIKPQTQILPFLAKNIHELLEESTDPANAVVMLVAPGAVMVEVQVECTDADDAEEGEEVSPEDAPLNFEVTLAEDGTLIERIEYDPHGATGRDSLFHTVRIHGFDDEEG